MKWLDVRIDTNSLGQHVQFRRSYSLVLGYWYYKTGAAHKDALLVLVPYKEDFLRKAARELMHEAERCHTACLPLLCCLHPLGAA